MGQSLLVHKTSCDLINVSFRSREIDRPDGVNPDTVGTGSTAVKSALEVPMWWRSVSDTALPSAACSFCTQHHLNER